MLVPLSVPSAQFWLLVLLQAHPEQSDMLFVVRAAKTERKEGSSYRICEDVRSQGVRRLPCMPLMMLSRRYAAQFATGALHSLVS